MTTVREQIIQATQAALNAAPPAGVPLTVRTNISIEEPEDLPSISVYPTREQKNDTQETQLGRWGPLIEKTLSLRFACIVSGDVPDQTADPLAQYLADTLSGNELGGLVTEFSETGTEWIYSETDSRVVGMFVDFDVVYQQNRTDSTSTT
jgi:hypothetical protein